MVTSDGGTGGVGTGGGGGKGGLAVGSSGGAGVDNTGSGGAGVDNTGSGGATDGPCAPVPVPEGGQPCAELLIDSAAAAAAAQSCTEVTGSLVVSPFFVGTIDLPRLTKVGGDVRRDGAKAPSNPNDTGQTTRLRLPNVTQIGGDLWFYLDLNLVELDLRSVKRIGGRGWVYRDTLISTLRLDALREVGMDFYIGDVTRLLDCVAKDIASHVIAGQGITAIGNATRGTCHCEPICNHVEQRCP